MVNVDAWITKIIKQYLPPFLISKLRPPTFNMLGVDAGSY